MMGQIHCPSISVTNYHPLKATSQKNKGINYTVVAALNLNPTDPPSKSEVFTSAIMGQSSFNLVSLFTRVLMKEAFNLTSCHFKKKILALLHVLNPSNFRFGGQSYIQTDGISMGLLLSPVIADSHTEDYEFTTFHHFVHHMNLNLIYLT